MVAQNRSSGSTVALEAMPWCSPCRADRKRGSIPEGGGEHKFDLEPLWSSTGQQAAQRGRKLRCRFADAEATAPLAPAATAAMPPPPAEEGGAARRAVAGGGAGLPRAEALGRLAAGAGAAGAGAAAAAAAVRARARVCAAVVG